MKKNAYFINSMPSCFFKYQKRLFVLLFGALFFISCSEVETEEFNFQFQVPELEYEIENYLELDSLLEYFGYELDSIHIYKKVPQVFVDQITPSIKMLRSDEKKLNFIRIILAHTLKVNEEIAQTRIHLYKRLNKDTLAHKDSVWLDSLSDVYRVKRQNYSDLINKIDIIPPSLIIVQGIIESGWATSKYAIEGNNLFGMYGSRRVVTKTGDTRPKAKDYETIGECVREYITNLNRHGSYRRMREVRAEMRDLGLLITGKKLASTLMNYSTLGERYVKKIVSMINIYDLEEYDQYSLKHGVVIKVKIQE
ncbi:MAG: glucosaminidase domain-containing protein [Crocinitomicaceae bacterium]|nr:glucosaminidase domain-containing protein [Crocinitomicaceae bacterium]